MSLSKFAQDIFIATSKESEGGLHYMRAKASEIFGSNDSILVGINGSYARREATSNSDADLFFLYDGDNESKTQDLQSSFLDSLSSSGYGKSASDGVFTRPLSISSIHETIGGLEDDNRQLTQRMLLLLEGDWIYNPSLFTTTSEKLIEKYVSDNLRQDQICLYLLNDIIRYWRTICVDYEFKVHNTNKPTNLRLIKLRFSRKLLFFAGVLAVSATHGLSVDEKRKKLNDLFALPPIERLQHLVSQDSFPALELYAEFLSSLDDSSIRNSLDDSPAFDNLRTKARDFDAHLLSILKKHCGDNNPTMNALLL